MSISTYITFEDQSKQAIDFYENVFNTTCENLVTYASLKLPDLDLKSQNFVMNATINVEGHTIMFSDTPSFMSKTPYGRTVSLVIELDNADKLKEYFRGLSENAETVMVLQKTEWSELFGQVTDKFGIAWPLNLISNLETR